MKKYSKRLKNKISNLYRNDLSSGIIHKIYPDISMETLHKIQEESKGKMKLNNKYISLMKNNAAEILKEIYSEDRDNGILNFMPIQNSSEKKEGNYSKRGVNLFVWIEKMIDEKKLTLNALGKIKSTLSDFPNEVDNNIFMAYIYQYFGLDEIASDSLNIYMDKINDEKQRNYVQQTILRINNGEKIEVPEKIRSSEISYKLEKENKKRHIEKAKEKEENKTLNSDDKNIKKQKNSENDKLIIKKIRNMDREQLSECKIEDIQKETLKMEDKMLATMIMSEVYFKMGMGEVRN